MNFKLFLIVVALLIVGLMATVKTPDAQADGFYVTRSTGVSISTGASFTITKIIVSSGTSNVVLIDTNSYAGNSGTSFPAVGVYPRAQRVIPEVTLSSITTIGGVIQGFTEIPLPMNGVEVYNGLTLYQNAYGAEVGIYFTERRGGRGR